MIGYITAIIVGIACIVIGITNMRGNISTLHSYHRARVKEEDIIPFGKMVGLGTITVGAGVILFGILSMLGDLLAIEWLIIAATVVMIAAIVVGMGITFAAMKKYNGGIM